MSIEQQVFDSEIENPASILQAELLAAGDRTPVWLSDFDKTLCDTYVYDETTNNHLAVIDPATVSAAAMHHLVVATSRRLSNPTVPLFWQSGLLPASQAAILENGGVIARPNSDGRLDYIDLVPSTDLEDLQNIPAIARDKLEHLPEGQRLVFKTGRTLLLARLQDCNGNMLPEHQSWLAEQLAELVPASLHAMDTRASVVIQPAAVGKDTAFEAYLDLANIRREDIFVIGMGDGPNDAGIFATADVSLGFSEAVRHMVDIDVPGGVRAVPFLFDAVRKIQTADRLAVRRSI